MHRDIRSTLRVVATICTVAVLAACVNLGPRAVQAGHGDYNTVLRDTTDEQLLVNLVRLRYRDRPYFREVSAVTTQFSFGSQLSAGAAVGARAPFEDASVEGGVAYSEVPTFTYTPLQGGRLRPPPA